MKANKIYLNAVLIALIVMLASAPLVWAGAEGGTPPDPNDVTGPEIWGTAVVRCEPSAAANFIAIRVKRIQDCNVRTDALIITPSEIENGCPETGNAFLYQQLNPGDLFSDDPTNVPQGLTPIVTKVKNFKVHSRNADGSDALLSFDAQIKFLNQ